MSHSKTTTNHEEIKGWVEKHGGTPARVKGTGSGDDPGVLRIDFPGFTGEDTLEAIEWEEWLTAFDENQLAFVYADDANSRFNKLVSRETAERRAASEQRAPH
jgi:hypothetical protein